MEISLNAKRAENYFSEKETTHLPVLRRIRIPKMKAAITDTNLAAITAITERTTHNKSIN